MLSIPVVRYGHDAPLPERKPLRAGPLRLLYENGDLRYITLGDQEIVRRIYVAVRDHNWGTILPVLTTVQMEIEADAFQIRYEVDHQDGAVDFCWKGAITGQPDGTVTMTMDGIARSSFLRNRIGFCILHPMRECAGKPCIVEKTDGTLEHGTFPRCIAAHQPFLNMRAISHEVLPGVRAEVRFEGDVFEMEDQRNWTDASYKTYSTPLALPFPVEIHAGTKITQSVTVTLQKETATVQVPVRSPEPSLTIGQSPTGPLPRIGVGTASHGQPLSENEGKRLKALHLAFLRVELTLSQPDFEATLRRAATEARALGTTLEAALFLSDNAEQELQALRAALNRVNAPVERWLIFHVAAQSTRRQWIDLARKYLRDYAPQAQIGGGTNHFFTELNRERPPQGMLDVVAYSMNPQVHAFDNTSLIETLETQAAIVESARQFVGSTPLAVGPVTLKPRGNPAAADSEDLGPADRLPSQVDVRQMSLFGAAWTLGSLKYLAESAVASVSYYETTGWRGVMETEAGSPMPERFVSLPGSVFPLYHVLADVGEFAGGDALPAQASHPLLVDGLSLTRPGRTRVLLANMTADPQQVTVENLSEHVSIRLLDDTVAEDAMRHPDAFRAHPGEPLQLNDGRLTLTLRPYAIARIDSDDSTVAN